MLTYLLPEAVCPFMTWFKDRNPKSLYCVSIIQKHLRQLLNEKRWQDNSGLLSSVM